MLKSLFQRSAGYFGGLSLSKILTTIVFILFARHFAPPIFGQFLLFYTLYVLFTLIGDLGLVQWYQKKANDEDHIRLFQKTVSARLLTLAISLFLAALFLLISKSFDSNTSMLFLIILVPEALLSISDGFYFVQKKPLKISIETGIKAIILLSIYAFKQTNFNLHDAVAGLVIGSLGTMLWIFPWQTLKNFALTSFGEMLNTLKQSAVYATLIATSYAYARGDSLVIRYSVGNAALGFYGAAYRYLESLALAPMAIQQNLFHLSSKPGQVSRIQLQKIVIVMAGVGLIAGLAVYFLSHFLIIDLLGSAYASSLVPLQIFSAVLLLFFINSPLSTVVQSSDLVKKFLPLGIANTVLNLGLNIVFVPVYGIVAAAWIMLITEISGLAINLYFVRKVYK